MNAIIDKPTRSKLLGAYLIVLVLLHLLLSVIGTGSLLGAIRDHDPQFTGTQQWALPLLIVLEIMQIGALVAIWFWRKAGYWVIIVTAVLETVLFLLLHIQFLIAIQPIAIMVIMWQLLQKRWQYFH